MTIILHNEGLEFFTPIAGDEPEVDRFENIPLPREMLSLIGHENLEREFLFLYRSKHIPHALMLSGLEGIGKATFAYRAARFLLNQENNSHCTNLSDDIRLFVPNDAQCASLIAHSSHPDVGVLKRRYDSKTKKIRSEIGVEDVRDALELFRKTPAFGGWRVIIVDSVDDLTISSANALLKTLEEPPPNTIFFLISHHPQRLLPTIRSRCHKFAFNPLKNDDVARIIAGLTNKNLDASIIRLANGSVCRGLQLLEKDVAAFLLLLEDIFNNLPKIYGEKIDKIAEKVRGGSEGEAALEHVLVSAEAWLHKKIKEEALCGNIIKASLISDIWGILREKADQVQKLNLDRRAFVIMVFEELTKI